MTTPVNNDTGPIETVSFSDYLNLIKFTLFSGDKISEKFKEFANTMVRVPINLAITDRSL